MDGPPRDEAARIERALKARPVSWREVTRRGQTNASHWLVELPSGEGAFVKCARGDDTASWIRDEHLVYTRTRGAGCSSSRREPRFPGPPARSACRPRSSCKTIAPATPC